VVLVEGPFTAEALERADVVVLRGAADPTLALDAMAFGCLVIAVGATRLDDTVIHGETGLVVEADALAGTIARHAEHARERDAGVDRALATNWEPAARALLDALDAARSRREAVAA
jgi:glycosyltransferase involved in cell wall biosynthesis